MNTTFPGEVRLAHVTERESLAKERDPELRADGLLSLAGREQAHGRSESAAEIYATLLQEPNLPESVRRRAQDRLGALRGDGPIGARVEVLLQRFTREMAEPTSLLAMGAAGAAFKMTRLVTLSRLAASPSATFMTRGMGARALAGLAGFGAEAAVFPLAGRLGSAAMGRNLDWSAPALGHDLLSSALTLGSLRSGGWLMGQAGRFAGGGAWTRSALAQAGMLGGILTSRRLEEGLGLRERVSGAMLLTDGLATLFQFNVAARLSRAAFGQRFASWEREVELHSQTLGRNLSLPSIALQGVPSLASAGTGLRASSPFDFNILMAQSHDSGRPDPSSVRPAEGPSVAKTNGGSPSTLPPPPPPESVSIPPSRPLEQVRREGETWELDFEVKGLEALNYEKPFGPELFNRNALAPTGMTFSKAYPAIAAATQEAMQRAPRPTVIHGVEEIQYFEPIRFGEPLTVRVTRKMRGAEGSSQMVFLTREIFRPSEAENGRPLAVGKSVLVVGPEIRVDGSPAEPVPAKELPALPPPVLRVEVTPELIDAFCRASGDFNPVHVSDAEAQKLGLPGRVLHGMATFNFAERAWHESAGGRLDRPYALKAAFSGMARPGDRLDFHVERSAAGGGKVEVLNQHGESIMTLRVSEPAGPSPRTVGIPENIERSFGSTQILVPAAAGRQAVERARERMAPFIPQLRQVLAQRPSQPWFIAGISDGMGFHSAVALMEAGVRQMVGGFYEPEALLKMGSSVHLGRLANVEGLRIFAQEKGIRLNAQYGDLVLPQADAAPRDLPTELRSEIREAQRRSWNSDLNFINSIAFARWISPSPGVETLKGIPSLDVEGRVVLMDMREYKEKGYEGTLDSMGRNHGAALATLSNHFGPSSASFFFTWAGGSQNTRILRGVYGGGVLGHAKEIGETDAIRYHLRSQDVGGALGVHKIVRFPDFPSFALFGIPGGGGFGMIARHVLEQHGVFADIGELAPRAYIEAFGGEHNLRNAAAQIELDVPESYHLAEIGTNLREFHRRVADYRAAHPEWTGKALDAQTSAELLQGLVSPDYVRQIPKATE